MANTELKIETEFEVEVYEGNYGQKKEWCSFRFAEIKAKSRHAAILEFDKVLKKFGNSYGELRLKETTSFTPSTHIKDVYPLTIC